MSHARRCPARMLATAAAAAVVCLAWYSPAPARQAAASELRVELEALLDAGLKSSPAALAEAQARFERARAIAPGDVRAPYSMALVLIRHRKFAEADQILAGIVQGSPQVIPAWRLKIHGQVMSHEYAGAMEDMVALARSFPRTEGEAKPVGKYAQAAGFLGRVMGYFEVPVESAVTEAARTNLLRTVKEQLPAAYRQAFENGRAAVAGRHGELASETEQIRRQELSDQQKKKELEVEFVAKERDRIAQERSAMEEHAAQLTESLKGELSAIDKELVPLQQRYAALLAEGRPIANEISALEVVIARLSREDSDDKERRGRNRGEIARLADRHRFLRRQYDMISLEARNVQIAGQKLQYQRNAAVARYQRDINELNRHEASLKRTERVLKSTELQATRPATGASARERALKAEMKLLRTYDEFSLDDEKALVLNSIR